MVTELLPDGYAVVAQGLQANETVAKQPAFYQTV